MTFPSLADAHAKWKLNFAEPLYGEHRSVATYLQVNFSSTFAIDSQTDKNVSPIMGNPKYDLSSYCTYYLSVTKETIET